MKVELIVRIEEIDSDKFYELCYINQKFLKENNLKGELIMKKL